MSCDISGLNKVTLLNALWRNMQPAAFFPYRNTNPPAFDNTLASVVVERYIDYFCGRAIKSDLSGDTAQSDMYDRDAGEGAFQRVVDSLRV